MCEGQNGEDKPDPATKIYAELCDPRQKNIAGCDNYKDCSECPLSERWAFLSSQPNRLGDYVRKLVGTTD